MDRDGAPDFHTDEYADWHEWQGDVIDNWHEAANDLLSTIPASQAGAVALIDWFVQGDNHGLLNSEEEEHDIALLKSLRAYLQAVA